MLDYFLRLLAYDVWANRRALESIRSVAAPDAKLLGLAAHVFASKRMWLGRICADADAGISTWPEQPLAQSEAEETAMSSAWEQYLGELAVADSISGGAGASLGDPGSSSGELERVVHYTTASGDPGRQTVGDIFTHKFLHAMYHRGQIAQLVRAQGGAPASTDFVVYAKALRDGAAG